MTNENYTTKKTTFMEARFHPSFWLDSFSWTDKAYFNEGLIKTHNPRFCIARFQTCFKDKFGITLYDITGETVVPMDKSYIFINYPDNELSDRYCGGVYSKLELGIYKLGLFIYVPYCKDEKMKQAEFKDLVDTICRFCGLYVATEDIIPHGVHRTFKFMIEPKFSDRDFELNKCPDIKTLYHLTMSSKVEKILRVGLNPRSSNSIFNYPDRIYLGLDPDKLEHVLLPAMKAREIKGGSRAILDIDISKIPSKNKFKVDPNYPDGLFTSDNIPPSAIDLFKDGIK